MNNTTNYLYVVTLSLPRKIRGLSKGLCLLVCALAVAATAPAQEFVSIEYLSPDWGPAMTWSGKTNEPPKFSDTEEEVYFIKQIGSFTRKQMKMRDPLSGKDTADEGHGISIWLCKMKSDGSEKAEIKELWRNPNYPIDTQGQSCWLNVNARTRKIALAIAYAGNDITGLWTMNLDGSDLKRIIKPEQTEKHLQAINHPSWTPDGQWIVFEEELRGMNPNRFNIARCSTTGRDSTRLLEATGKPQYMQPSVSPDGKWIAFTRYPDGYPGQRYIWLMGIDGTQPHQLVDRKRVTDGWGDWPTWSPDAKNILIIGGDSEIIDVATGRVITDRRPVLQGDPHKGTCGWPQWGRLGFVGFSVGGILFTDSELREAKWVGSSKLVKCPGEKVSCRW